MLPELLTLGSFLHLDAAELFVALPGVRGRYGLTFQGATILGERGTVEDNRQRFEEGWRGTRSGGGRWVPLVPPRKEGQNYYS